MNKEQTSKKANDRLTGLKVVRVIGNGIHLDNGQVIYVTWKELALTT